MTEHAGAGQLTRGTSAAAWAVRGLSLAMAVAAAWIGWKKFRPSDEQAVLRRYVELEVPALMDSEHAVQERLDRLAATPSPSPEQARALLVGNAIPKVIALRGRAAAIDAHAPPLDALAREYLAYLDLLLDACRAAVRAIDDPKLDAKSGARAVRDKFIAAGDASRAWAAHLRAACEQAGFRAPSR